MADREPLPTDSAAHEILSYTFLKVFAHDHIIDEGELAFMEELALRDGVVDSRERAVLSRIFDRVDPEALDPKVREEIERFRERHGIP